MSSVCTHAKAAKKAVAVAAVSSALLFGPAGAAWLLGRVAIFAAHAEIANVPLPGKSNALAPLVAGQEVFHAP